MQEIPQIYLNLATALALGLLIGVERGWSGRATPDHPMAAGIRTHALLSLLGAIAALLIEPVGAWAWLVLALVVGLLVLSAYLNDLRHERDMGLTSEIAMLLTFCLGTVAGLGMPMLAAGCAVVVALLLKLKPALHQLLTRLSENEVSGALKLLFISLVVLPWLPNQGYGPWQVFNPYSIWWMVVLIAGIGFAAYVAVRLVGAHHGLLLSAVLGGLVSSTAMTLTLARLHEQKQLRPILACGLLATSALMFPRVLLEVGIVNPPLLQQLWLPMSLAALVYAGGALLLYLRARREPELPLQAPLKNPFELLPALRFAALLLVILFLVEGGRHWLGDTGIYLVAALSGLTDVDAITLSLSHSARTELDHGVAIRGIYLAAVSNSLTKAALIALIGGRDLAWRCLPIMVGGLLLGLAALLVQ